VRERVQALIRLVSGGGLLAILLIVTHGTASDPTEGALLGIAVRTMAGTVQECRALSEEELAALPRHMRRSEVCESHAVPYRLEVTVDGEPRLDRIYRAAGIHGDRPLTVEERIRVRAGVRAVGIRFAPVESPGPDHAPPVFTLEQEVSFAEGRIRVAKLEGVEGGFEIR
jgi:hypothetical protein